MFVKPLIALFDFKAMLMHHFENVVKETREGKESKECSETGCVHWRWPLSL